MGRQKQATIDIPTNRKKANKKRSNPKTNKTKQNKQTNPPKQTTYEQVRKRKKE